MERPIRIAIHVSQRDALGRHSLVCEQFNDLRAAGPGFGVNDHRRSRRE